jgi:hypothetical protein
LIDRYAAASTPDIIDRIMVGESSACRFVRIKHRDASRERRVDRTKKSLTIGRTCDRHERRSQVVDCAEWSHGSVRTTLR